MKIRTELPCGTNPCSLEKEGEMKLNIRRFFRGDISDCESLPREEAESPLFNTCTSRVDRLHTGNNSMHSKRMVQMT